MLDLAALIGFIPVSYRVTSTLCTPIASASLVCVSPRDLRIALNSVGVSVSFGYNFNFNLRRISGSPVVKCVAHRNCSKRSCVFLELFG